MTCDPHDLLNNGKCFTCLSPYQIQVIQTQLLCEILVRGGHSQDTCLSCGTTDPTDPATCDCSIYYNKNTGEFWYWDSDGEVWVAFP